MPHIHERVDFTVEAFVVHKNKVLLRKHDPGRERARRAPLISNFAELIPSRFLNRRRISPAHEHVTFIYFATSETDRVVEPETGKGGGFVWAGK